jgi:Biotin-requiring enzyme
MLEIVLTREDANTEYALLAEWLVEDRVEVTAGQPVCVVETTKATVEVEAPGAGTIVQLYAENVEVELGKTIAYLAESADELASIDAKAEEKPAPKPAAGDRKATRKAVELAELHGIDLASVEKRGFITEKDVEALIDAQKGAATPSASPALAGVSTAGVSLPDTFDPDGTSGALEPSSYERLLREQDDFRALPPAEKVRLLREYGAEVGEDVELGEGSLVVAPRIVISRARPSCARRCSPSERSPSSASTSSCAAAAPSSARGSGADARSGSAAAATGIRGPRWRSVTWRSSATRRS